MKLKIGVITNYEYSEEERASRATDGKCEFVFAEGMLDGAVDVGRYMQNDQRVHAILTTSLTSRYLRKELDIPVLPLKLRNYDIIRAFLRAKQLGDRPAFLAVDTDEVEYDFDEILNLLGFPVKYYEFPGFERSPRTFRQIIRDGCDVIVSIGNVGVPLANERGIETVCMTPDISTFQEAVTKVKYIYADRRANDLQQTKHTAAPARSDARKKGFAAEYNFSDIKGTSDLLRNVKATAKKYACSDVNILICGESGCGKEVFAQSIHNFSAFRDGPFVAVNCTSLPDNLLESELFGYEDGAFTGAKRGGNPGLFELAHGGTLFLDEIGDMPLHLQVKLLRVLEERTVRRVGGNRNIPVSVRLIFATNRNIRELVRRKDFREDLYYRINVLTLHIPPLRDRPEDIALLAEDLAAGVCRRMGQEYFFPSDCTDIIESYSWPGNVRELSNFMERVIVLRINDRETIGHMIAELSADSQPALCKTLPNGVMDDSYLRVGVGSMRDMENEIIASLLARYGGDKRKLAWTLGLSGTTLWRRLKELEG